MDRITTTPILLTLLVCLYNSARAQDECVFVMSCDKALFGNNDKKITDVTVEECKDACLAETDFTCLSVDYITSSGNCYLSMANAITNPDDMGKHSGATHYDWVCDQNDIMNAMWHPLEGTDCGFTMHCGMALFGFNTKTMRSVTLEQCMNACYSEDAFDCLSFDYNPSSENCYLSEESAKTQKQDMGSHGQTDYYEKMCLPGAGGQGEGSAYYSDILTDMEFE